jgi:hypothetical protein
MPAYMHMGHDTENLIDEQALAFQGIILSPVNREPEFLLKFMKKLRTKTTCEVILDPQLYFPRGKRGCVNKQPYFPSDFESVDVASPAWWGHIVGSLADYAIKLNIDLVAFPTIHPRIWDDGYFNTCVKSSNELNKILSKTSIKVFTTVLVNTSQLADEKFVLWTASLVTGQITSGFYLVLSGDVDPRRELNDSEEILGIMRLIRELRRTKLPVIVSHCASDMILFRAAGATACATGKFFNLRRFTKSRYNEPDGGGGQLPYWFEHSLLSFIRESDILRLKQGGFDNLVCNGPSDNIWGKAILDNFQKVSYKPWLGNGWRQYLAWFSKASEELDGNDASVIVHDWLKAAENNWIELEDAEILMEEPRNNGRWLRPWRQALAKFLKS